MNIAYITHYFPPARFAAAINTYRIVKGLLDRGHEISVFCPSSYSPHTAPLSSGSANWPQNLSVHQSLPNPLPLSTTIPHILNTFKLLAKGHDFNLVITQFHMFHLASLSGFLLKHPIKMPWVVKVHDIIRDPNTMQTPIYERIFSAGYYKAFLSFFGKKADKMLVLTNELRDFLLNLGYDPQSVSVIPHGVDINIFRPSTSNKNPTGKTILYIGSMTPDDGLEHLIRAFALLQNKGLQLVMIGEGPQRSRLIELAQHLSLQHKVIFHRYVPHDSMPDFIRSACITVGPLCLSPVNGYTIPTKLLEYFSCGKPAVSAPVSRDIMKDEFNGLVVRKITPEDIAAKLSTLLEDEKMTVKMGENARRLIVEKFDWENAITQIEKEILDVASHRSD